MDDYLTSSMDLYEPTGEPASASVPAHVLDEGRDMAFLDPDATQGRDSLPALSDATIMMVDDEATTIDVIQMLLEDSGYSRFVATTQSTRVMALLEEVCPDLMLLDLMMPDVSGFEILASMRADRRFARIPIIVLTSSTDAATKLKALELGTTDFLGKPVDPSELVLRVRNNLGIKAYQDRIRQERGKSERASRAKSEFLSETSHELRTPLNAVLGFGRLLKANASLTNKQGEFLDHILDSGEHLLRLIEEFLDIGKIESGRMELSLETVEPADVLGECMVLIEPLAESHGITIEIRVSASVAPAVIAERTRLKQALLNLMSNAVKYNCDNGRVTVSCREVEGGLRISVTDTGPGLAEESIAEMFEPFARLKAEQDGIEGTGIGLAITKRLVELMGGQLGVQSTLGEGSSFWVEFPLACAPSVERVEAEQAASETISTLRGRILLAEDNPVNRVLALAMLEPHELEVDVAENGHDALEAYLAQSYDVVLMDCQMPQMDGFEATEEIRRREVAGGAKTSIPIIAVTASAMSGDRERCFAAGMSDFLSKPYTEEEMLEMLARWLPAVNTPVEVSADYPIAL